MFVTFQRFHDMQQLAEHREERIRFLENELELALKELELEKTWAEGEIEFWQDQCFISEQKECQCVPTKPWWRHIIS